MCGIAAVVSGVRITRPNPSTVAEPSCLPLPETAADDLKAALSRRGPDHLGTREVVLRTEEEGNVAAGLQLFGATLHLRGDRPVVQPLADSSGNLLVYNGEIFGGIHVSSDNNDSEVLLLELEKSSESNGKSVPEILSMIRGPWALIYWQEKSKTIWFGRDCFGRRSVLVHWPTLENSKLILSSVSPSSMSSVNGSIVGPSGDFAAAYLTSQYYCWEELPCGIYSIQFEPPKITSQGVTKTLVGKVHIHEWTDVMLKELIEWERPLINPKVKDFSLPPFLLQEERYCSSSCISTGSSYTDYVRDLIQEARDQMNNVDLVFKGITQSALKALIVLRESVMRRAVLNTPTEALNETVNETQSPIAVLFSGGLDSMILAALLNHCLSSRYAIDLLNVSFDGQLAPDRISARAGIRELQAIAPSRRWCLVEIDSSLSELAGESKHVMSLIHPAKTYMDLNIGLALWLAAKGDGLVDTELCNHSKEKHHRYRYKSIARILLVGSGADEQCAGYGRHRTKYRLGGWDALQEEMRLDMQRIWRRNLGRDDRCISDNGKEARFPFLDEDVIRTLLEVPLWEVADLHEPSGKGDKKILREVAQLLGLKQAATMPKRAIQFGSRISRESNKINFSSNRAANQASAGSVEITGYPVIAPHCT